MLNLPDFVAAALSGMGWQSAFPSPRVDTSRRPRTADRFCSFFRRVGFSPPDTMATVPALDEPLTMLVWRSSVDVPAWPTKPPCREKAAASKTAANTQITWNGPTGHRNSLFIFNPARPLHAYATHTAMFKTSLMQESCTRSISMRWSQAHHLFERCQRIFFERRQGMGRPGDLSVMISRHFSDI